MARVNLDRLEEMTAVDKQGMLSRVEAFPDQCREAIDIGRGLDVRRVTGGRPNSVAVLGMGGSGVSGDVIRAVADPMSPVPVWSIKGYQLPGYVTRSTLCVAASYSGTTEETLSCFDQAIERGCKVICVTTGNELAERAARRKVPCAIIPSGLQPRAALGYLALPILIALEQLKIVPDQAAAIDETLFLIDNMVRQFKAEQPAKHNQAKQLASRLANKMPVVYGSDGIMAVAALRWKCQFNENSKAPSFWNVLPELNHNETVGWEELLTLTKRFALVMLRDRMEDPRVAKRFEVTRALIEDHFGRVLEVWSDGRERLARLMTTILLGDFVSVYLAIQAGVDPTPVERVQELKRRLAQ